MADSDYGLEREHVEQEHNNLLQPCGTSKLSPEYHDMHQIKLPTLERRAVAVSLDDLNT